MISNTEIILRLTVALVLGGVIGYERERDNQPAGLRTHMILVLGACLAMILSINIAGEHDSDPLRLAAQVVSGIGFLGAGAILRFGFNVRGLTTASTLWTMAIVGMAVGYGYYLIGALTTVFMLLTLTVVNLFEKRYVRGHVTRHLLIEIRDQPGVLGAVRSTVDQLAEKTLKFSLKRSLKMKRIRLEIIARMKLGEQLETLIEKISAIDGVQAITVE